MESTKPSLIEPGVKYFLNETLKQCNHFRNAFHNTIFNMIIGTIFLLILGMILLYKYKGKLTPSEKEVKHNPRSRSGIMRVAERTAY
jgi:16S rRNA C1402 N4-methylase RsmH